MKALKYILSFLFFVVVTGGSEAIASGQETYEAAKVSVVSEANVSTNHEDSILPQPFASVVAVQRIQNGARQQETEQRRCHSHFNISRTTHFSSCHSTYPLHIKPISASVLAHRFISLGRLII